MPIPMRESYKDIMQEKGSHVFCNYMMSLLIFFDFAHFRSMVLFNNKIEKKEH